MADLLNSLISSKYETAHHNNSQDSFHSVQEEIPDSNPISQWIDQVSLQEQTDPSTTHIPTDFAPQNKHQAYDIDAYLSHTSNIALLNSPTTKRPAHSFIVPVRTTVSTAIPHNFFSPTTPTLNTPPGYYLQLLNQGCQIARLTPEFTVWQVPGKVAFAGELKIGSDITVTLPHSCRSKKEAREQLAEKAIKPLRALANRSISNPKPAVQKDAEIEEDGGDGTRDGEPNWIGLLQGISQYCLRQVKSTKHISISLSHSSYSNLLVSMANTKHWQANSSQEYHQTATPPPTPTYTFYTPSLQTHACVVTRAVTTQNPGRRTFGSPIEPFPTKKAAQQAAAKEAVEYLIGIGELNADGSVIKRKRNTNVNRIAEEVSMG